MWTLVITVLVVLAGLVLWQIFTYHTQEDDDNDAAGHWFCGRAKPDPKHELDRIIDEERIKLKTAQLALTKSAELVRRLQREKGILTKDIDELKGRIACPATEEAEAKRLTGVLLLCEGRQNRGARGLAEAIEAYTQHSKVIAEFQTRIHELRIQADTLSVQRDLALARKDAASLAADQNTGIDTTGWGVVKSKLTDDITTANVAAEVDERLAQPGRGFVDVDAAIAARLAELRQNNKEG